MKTIPSRRITSKAEQQENTKEPATRHGIVPVKSLHCVFERQKRRFIAELLDFICIHIYNYMHKSSHGPQPKHGIAVHAGEGRVASGSISGTDFDKERFK